MSSMYRGDEPLVSVIVPAFNAAQYVRDTLESVLAQTHRNIEVIVVDDGSTDDTPEIVSEIAATDPRVRLMRQANAGAAAARNTGIAAAQGAFIAPVDADDLWHPTKIAKQLARMRESRPEVGLVYCWSAKIDAEGRVIDRRTGARVEGDVYGALLLYNFLDNGSTPLIRRSCLERTGTYGEMFRHAADFLFYLAVAEHYDFAVVPEFLVGYRRFPGSLSTNALGLARYHDRVLARARRRHPELPERLIRWSHVGNAFGAAGKCLRAGRVRDGASLLFRLLLTDPALVCTLAARRRARRQPGPHFFELPPEPSGPPDPEPFGRRRHAYVTSVRIRRPSRLELA